MGGQGAVRLHEESEGRGVGSCVYSRYSSIDRQQTDDTMHAAEQSAWLQPLLQQQTAFGLKTAALWFEDFEAHVARLHSTARFIIQGLGCPPALACSLSGVKRCTWGHP